MEKNRGERVEEDEGRIGKGGEGVVDEDTK
jgi:hypothetical protein